MNVGDPTQGWGLGEGPYGGCTLGGLVGGKEAFGRNGCLKPVLITYNLVTRWQATMPSARTSWCHRWLVEWMVASLQGSTWGRSQLDIVEHQQSSLLSESLILPRLTGSLVYLENVSQLHTCTFFSSPFIIVLLSPVQTEHRHPPLKLPASCVFKLSQFISPFLSFSVCQILRLSWNHVSYTT